MPLPPDASELMESPLQVWGGVEYTCNRVGDRYIDQMEISGHAERVGDYARIAELGIRTLRVGLLWERHARDVAWDEADAHLASLRGLGVRPIAGLLHHGSGPMHTDLLDPRFPEKLASYAAEVARRYPWIDAYTPVNEPNTTARFSGMYGLWYPHHRSRGSYLKALINELKATVLSMESIRRIRPDAQLIQTDDLGRISGTEDLRSSWELLNLRQWLTFDLLCGKVCVQHPMHAYMRREGITEREIAWFEDHSCPPDVVGMNHYVTSDRYLDHRLDRYSEDKISSEGPFADVETVRASREGIVGIDQLLQEAWDRYGIPIAITEVHLGSTAEEQIRWLTESWEGAMRARQLGVKCVAITVWALLGSFFWNDLVTHENGHYEAGAFLLKDGALTATPLASLVKQLATGHGPDHPALTRKGWWHQLERMSLFEEGDCK